MLPGAYIGQDRLTMSPPYKSANNRQDPYVSDLTLSRFSKAAVSDDSCDLIDQRRPANLARSSGPLLYRLLNKNRTTQ
jgi:hypothetical protein